MKFKPLIFCLLIYPAAAGEVKLGNLKTEAGKEYSGVTVRGFDARGVKIMHDSGAAVVAYGDLPENIRQRMRVAFPASPDALAEKEAEARDQIRKEWEEERKKRERMTPEEKKDRADEEATFLASIHVDQVVPDGLLCTGSITPPDLRPVSHRYFVRGKTSGLVDNTDIKVWLRVTGTYSYITALGTRATVTELTACPPPVKKP